MNLGLGLWPIQPETRGAAGENTFPKFGVSYVGKSMELVAATLWDLGLDILGLYEALTASAHALIALVLLACIFFRPCLLYFSAKHMFLWNSGSTPLRDAYFCDWFS